MKKILMYSVILLFSLILFNCSEDNTDRQLTPADMVNNSIIDIPGCISSKSSSKGIKSSSDDQAGDVYEGIRETIGGVEEWTEVIKEIVGHIYTITGFNSTGSWTRTEPDPNDPNAPDSIVWGPDEVNGYEHKVELYWSGIKGFEAYLTIDEEKQAAKGVFTWYLSVLPDESSDANVQITFDGTSEPKTLKIVAVDMNTAVTADEPDKAWINVELAANHIIKLGGNFNFPNIDLMDSGSSENRNYVFTVIGYDESGMDVDHVNQAILQLALPLSIQNNLSSMWSDDSISKIFIGFVKDEWDATDITNIKNWLTASPPPPEYPIDLAGVVTGTDITDDINVINILKYAESTSNGDFSSLIFVLNLVNPAYYMENGFFGTWDGTRGTLNSAADIPASFDNLDINSVTVITPAALDSETVSFL